MDFKPGGLKVRKWLKSERIEMVELSGFEPLASTMPSLLPAKKGVKRGKPETLSKRKRYEIPAGFSLIPAIEWVDGVPKIFRVLTENLDERREKSVKSRRVKAGARHDLP